MPSGVFERPRRDGTIAYLARPRVDGKRVTVGTFNSEQDAIDAITEHRKSAGAKRSDSITVNQLCDSWLELHVRDYLQPSTAADYEAAAADFCATFGHLPVKDLDDMFEEIQRWAKTRAQDRVNAARAMFGWGRRRRLVRIANPLEFVKARKPVKRAVMPSILTDDEVRELAQIAHTVHYEPIASTMAAYLKIMFGTGLRPVQLRKLRWRDVDLTRRRLLAPAAKRGRAQEVAILAVAMEGFRETPRGLPDQYVFLSTTGHQLSKSTAYNWWKPIRDAANRQGMILYDLRDSQLTRLVKAGVGWHNVAKQATHSDNGQTLARHYVHIEIEDALEEIEAADQQLHVATAVTHAREESA